MTIFILFQKIMYIQTFKFLSGLKLEIFDQLGISAGVFVLFLIGVVKGLKILSR